MYLSLVVPAAGAALIWKAFSVRYSRPSRGRANFIIPLWRPLPWFPLFEYLSTIYHPDCDYLEGILEERNAGEISHSEAQSALTVCLRTAVPGFWAAVEVRVQVKATRFRIPDVTIMRAGKPSGRVITTPPEVAVEILSPEDRAASIQERIDDYLAFGIPDVWVINPESRRAWLHTNDGSREAKDGVLRNLAGDLTVPLASVFVE